MEHITYIGHVDGDSFFASCEVARFPHLRNTAVVIGQERGIVTALTAEAKALGIQRGDSLYKIRNDYKNVTILPANFELYKQYAKNLAIILRQYCDVVETYSIDECFFEISFQKNTHPHTIKTWLGDLQTYIHKQLGITYSLGLSTSKTLAKVASKMNKPCGCEVLITQHDVQCILKKTSVSDIWGVGRQFNKKLLAYGIATAYDFVHVPPGFLQTLGSPAPLRDTQQELQGVQRLPVSNKRDVNDHQSMQSTRMLVFHTTQTDIIFSELSRHVEILSMRMVREGLVAKKIAWFVRVSDAAKGHRAWFESDLPTATANPSLIMNTIKKCHIFSLADGEVYKGTGISAVGLVHESYSQQDLFEESVEYLHDDVSKLLCGVKDKFGSHVIMLASSQASFDIRSNERERHIQSAHYITGLPFPYLGEVV